MSEVVGANFSAKMLRLIDWSSTLLNFLGERRGSIFEGSVSALCNSLLGCATKFPNFRYSFNVGTTRFQKPKFYGYLNLFVQNTFQPCSLGTILQNRARSIDHC